MNFKTQYTPQERVQVVNEGESRTKQSFKKEADVNYIVGRFRKTGELPSPSQIAARYMDVSEVGDFLEVANIIKAADADFMRFPAAVREVFGHDPARMLDAVYNGDTELLIKAGFIDPPQEPTAAPAASPEPEAPQGASGE